MALKVRLENAIRVMGPVRGSYRRSDRAYPAGDVFTTGRTLNLVPAPPPALPVRGSRFSGEVGWRQTQAFMLERRPWPFARLMGTRFGLTFFAPATRARIPEIPAVMRPKPRFTRVLRYPRGVRAPRTYGRE